MGEVGKDQALTGGGNFLWLCIEQGPSINYVPATQIEVLDKSV